METLETEISPYRDTLNLSMNVVIGQSGENMIKNRPCSALNNWIADALLNDQDSLSKILKPNMVLLNMGSIRSSINQGGVTLGDIYTLMPFDNEVVWVKLPISVLKDIEDYIRASGGEPIANAVFNKSGLSLLGEQEQTDVFWVLTSDYLLNGGDRMTFFEQKLEVLYTGRLLRDSFIDEVKKQGNLKIDKNCRIDVTQ